MTDRQLDLMIIGGGLGGCAAALAACSKGLRVVLTEETDWLGGQVTSQGVPPDEHKWIEEFGSTARYQSYRERVRRFYTEHMDVTNDTEPFNPGNGLVSNMCHDPRVTVHVLNEMLLPYVLTHQLTIKLETVVTEVERQNNEVQTVTCKNKQTDQTEILHAPYFIDATEMGEFLPLADMNYITGAESKHDTEEPHAVNKADPTNIQAFTHVLAMEYRAGEDHTIPKPEMYSFWKSYKPDIWPDQYLSFYGPHPVTGEKRKYALLPNEEGFSLWAYRRSFDHKQFHTAIQTGDISLMNWPMNDYFLGNVYDVSNEEKEKHEHQAKQLSLSLLYWLQTEAPRPDGGRGYPGLRLRPDVMGTQDGLAKAPYIRESRRIKAVYTIVEQDVSPDMNEGKVGKLYDDRVGIGHYSIDLHPSMSGAPYIDIPVLPFHIPLGALLPQDVDNVLAGSKNIGTTHITNGCYRLHPVEWNVGEAAGALIAYCLQEKCDPKTVRADKKRLTQFQAQLRADGFELEWPDAFYE